MMTPSGGPSKITVCRGNVAESRVRALWGQGWTRLAFLLSRREKYCHNGSMAFAPHSSVTPHPRRHHASALADADEALLEKQEPAYAPASGRGQSPPPPLAAPQKALICRKKGCEEAKTVSFWGSNGLVCLVTFQPASHARGGCRLILRQRDSALGAHEWVGVAGGELGRTVARVVPQALSPAAGHAELDGEPPAKPSSIQP
jgi:hypothetical protein